VSTDTVMVGIHTRPDTLFHIEWVHREEQFPGWDEWYVRLKVGVDTTVYLDPADLARLAEVLRTAGTPTGPACLTSGCEHPRGVHFGGGCDVATCECELYRDEPQGAGADPWGRTPEDMARSAE